MTPQTSKGDPCGYIDARGLEELWFHTGTRCNLQCPFCLEGSGPTADRLDYLTLGEVWPLMEKAVDLGVERFSFTGGEPFLNPHFLEILTLALGHRPCLVLTNGTKPLHLKQDALSALKPHGERLRFRVSLDHPDPRLHDEGRGEGSFDLAIRGMKLVREMGFGLSIAAQLPSGSNQGELDNAYRKIMVAQGLPEDVHIVFFPDFKLPGAEVEVPEITETCMTRYHTEQTRSQFMCAFSRMVIKRDGLLKLSACTLVDDDPNYDVEADLEASVSARVHLTHHRCFSCFAGGASCSEG